MAVFNLKENKYFDAVSGARSPVTEREATGDKSVTLDRDEKNVLYQLYPAESFTRGGGAEPDEKPETYPFNIYNVEDGTSVIAQLAIKYPKSEGNELRLYFKKGVFNPVFGEEWFIFTRAGDAVPYIGSYQAERLANLLSDDAHSVIYEQDYGMDPEDMAYQAAIASPKARQDGASYVVTSFKRDAGIAARAIEKAAFRCEVDSNHQTFISGSSDKPFVEVHHLIPMAYSRDFEYSLDHTANLIVMCPNCHREIHYGTRGSKQIVLSRLYDERIADLTKAGIHLAKDQLFFYYGCAD